MKLAKKTKASTAKSVAEFIDQQIEYTDKTALQIAEEVGFPKANIVSMIRYGKTKLPIARVGKMAKALEVDPILLLRLVMQEYDPEGWGVIQSIIGREAVTSNEYEWVSAIRALDLTDPKPTKEAVVKLQTFLEQKVEATSDA